MCFSLQELFKVIRQVYYLLVTGHYSPVDFTIVFQLEQHTVLGDHGCCDDVSEILWAHETAISASGVILEDVANPLLIFCSRNNFIGVRYSLTLQFALGPV